MGAIKTAEDIFIAGFRVRFRGRVRFSVRIMFTVVAMFEIPQMLQHVCSLTTSIRYGTHHNKRYLSVLMSGSSFGDIEQNSV